MQIDINALTSVLPVEKSLSKTDFIYRIKLSSAGNNSKLLDLLYMLPFHRIMKDIHGKLIIH